MDPIRNRSIINYSNPSIARFHFVYKGLWESIVQRPYMGPRGRQPKSGLRHSDGHPLISRDHPNSGHWAVSTGRPKTALYFVTALQLEPWCAPWSVQEMPCGSPKSRLQEGGCGTPHITHSKTTVNVTCFFSKTAVTCGVHTWPSSPWPRTVKSRLPVRPRRNRPSRRSCWPN